MPTINAGLYALDPFSTPNPDQGQCAAIAAAAEELKNSQFNNILFASFHVHDNGDVYWNDTLVATGGVLTTNLAPDLPGLIADMKGANPDRKVLMSIGGGGCINGQAVGYWDFTAVKGLIGLYPDPDRNPFFQNLKATLRGLNLDGVDLDLEVYATAICPGGFGATYTSFRPTLLAIVKWCVTEGTLVTAAPYEDPTFWAGLLDGAYAQNNNVQPFAWFNLQNAVNNATLVQDFTTAIQSMTTGIASIPEFLSIGMQVGTSESAANVEEFFSIYPGNSNGFTGGWLWNNNSCICDPIAAYATAVINALD